ncbi:MAG TPA: oligosaccharide flippase family protein, partial [Blastocatellia bacterium]|nr:oligosaccharide flippase family protein [Blastocatellia bacterium]
MQESPDGLANTTAGEPPQPLRYVAARAAMASGTAEIVTRVLTVVLAIVTARVLEPVEVGILGLSVIVIGVVSMLGFYPETAAIAARGEEGESQYAFAAAGIRAAILACSLATIWLGFSAVARYLTGNDNAAGPLRELLFVLAWMPVLELLSGYPQVVMQRRLELNFIARLQILQPVIFVGLAVAMLTTGRGYIGVAWANIASSVVITLLLWWRLLSTGSARWCGWPSRKVWRETLHGTGKVLIGGFGGYLGERVDNLLVAGSIGPAAMSFYSMAWNASRTPANVFARAINFVLVPALARIQDDPLRVQRALRECVRNSYLLLAPACAILFVTAPLLVNYVIGPKWLPLIPALRVMCFTVLAVPILFASAALLVGTGRGHLVGIATGVQLATLFIAIPPLCGRWGILGAAYADSVAVSLLTLTLGATAWFATRQVGLSVLKTAAVPLVSAVSSGCLAFVLTNSIQSDALRFSFAVCLT